MSVGESAAERRARLLSYQAGEDALAVLEGTVRRVEQLLHGVSNQALSRRPSPGKWSVQEILAHLADTELVVAYRIRKILSLPGTAMEGFDQDAWARAGRHSQIAVTDSLILFSAVREANLRLLRSLEPNQVGCRRHLRRRRPQPFRDFRGAQAPTDHQMRCCLVDRAMGASQQSSRANVIEHRHLYAPAMAGIRLAMGCTGHSTDVHICPSTPAVCDRTLS